MRKLGLYTLIWIISGFMLIACQRDRGVYAGNDQYQPRPVPKGDVVTDKGRQRELKGELARIDRARKIFVIRVENGMEQTFKYDDDTMVRGLEDQNAPMRNLMGKEGSEISVKWQDAGGIKSATNIDVTQISTAKSLRRGRKQY
jgi:hypothetical protein